MDRSDSVGPLSFFHRLGGRLVLLGSEAFGSTLCFLHSLLETDSLLTSRFTISVPRQP
jgi:hypothetical protein